MSDPPRIEALRRRVQQDPASIAFAELAEEYRRAGRHDEAVAACRAGLAQHPCHVPARVTLGRALVSLDQDDEAQIELETVLRAAPDNFFALRTLAQIQKRRSELTEVAARATPAADSDVRLHGFDEGRDRHPHTDDSWNPADTDHHQEEDDRRVTTSGALFNPPTSPLAANDFALQELEHWLDAILTDRAHQSHKTV